MKMEFNYSYNILYECFAACYIYTGGTRLTDWIEQNASDCYRSRQYAGTNLLATDIMLLEKEVGELLDKNADKLHFYFDDITKDDEKYKMIPFGFSRAKLLYSFHLLRGVSMEEIIATLLYTKKPERLLLLSETLPFEYNKSLSTDLNADSDAERFDKFLHSLDALTVSAETRWMIVDCYLHFEEYVEGLAVFIKPLYELLTQRLSSFTAHLEYFKNRYPTSARVLEFVNSLYPVKLNANGDADGIVIYVLPSLFSSGIASSVDERYLKGNHFLYISISDVLTLDYRDNMSPDDVSYALQLMGEPTRFKMLCAIHDEPMYLTQIAKHFSLDKGTAAHHLNRLADAGLVHVTYNGYKTYYSLSTRITDVMDMYRRLLVDEAATENQNIE